MPKIKYNNYKQCYKGKSDNIFIKTVVNEYFYKVISSQKLRYKNIF